MCSPQRETLLGPRRRVLLVFALCLSLSVLSWLRPLEATQRDVQLDNAERLRRGIPALREDSGLDSIAYRHSQEMAAKGTIWHDTSTQRASQPWIAYGENVGMGPTLDAVHQAFMNSPEHRQNILEPFFKEMGAGVAGRGGVVYVTEIFVTRPTRSPSKASVRPVAPRKRPLAIRRPPRRPKPSWWAVDARLAVAQLLRLASF